MIVHIVLLQTKAEVKDEEISAALEQVRGLQQSIPGLTAVQAGKSSYQGYTYGFVMQFVDAEHLKAYISHPAHQRVAEELQRLCQKALDFDIE